MGFQPLIPEDLARFGEPILAFIEMPVPETASARHKLIDWVNWRAAPYPADRTGQYLFIPGVDEGAKILVSAVMRTPDSIPAYIESLRSKDRYTVRGRKASARGYSARGINPSDHSRDIFAIVHSAQRRQGRPLAAMFADRSADFDFSAYRSTGDPRFDDICSGVFLGDELVAYLLGKRVGHHVQYDEIMGHADHLHNDIMYLLHFHFLQMCVDGQSPPEWLNYGPWYSGSDPFSPKGGLNRWKRKVGFKPGFLTLASY